MTIDTDPPQMCLCTLYTCTLCLYSSVVLGLHHFAAVFLKLKTFEFDMVLSEICLVVLYVTLGVFSPIIYNVWGVWVLFVSNLSAGCV